MTIVLRLYVAGEAPNSVRARANLKTLCSGLEPGHRYRVEVIDILETPQQAIHDGVVLTPTLVKASPPPACKMVGDLSDLNRVKTALGLEGAV